MMMIFTCSTSKLSGVPLISRNMIKLSVCMPTIGRITDESQVCFNTSLMHAVHGVQRISSWIMSMDVQINLNAINVMDGRNLSITLRIIRQSLVQIKNHASSKVIALFIISHFDKTEGSKIMAKLKLINLFLDYFS